MQRKKYSQFKKIYIPQAVFRKIPRIIVVGSKMIGGLDTSVNNIPLADTWNRIYYFSQRFLKIKASTIVNNTIPPCPDDDTRTLKTTGTFVLNQQSVGYPTTMTNNVLKNASFYNNAISPDVFPAAQMKVGNNSSGSPQVSFMSSIKNGSNVEIGAEFVVENFTEVEKNHQAIWRNFESLARTHIEYNEKLSNSSTCSRRVTFKQTSFSVYGLLVGAGTKQDIESIGLSMEAYNSDAVAYLFDVDNFKIKYGFNARGGTFYEDLIQLEKKESSGSVLFCKYIQYIGDFYTGNDVYQGGYAKKCFIVQTEESILIYSLQDVKNPVIVFTYILKNIPLFWNQYNDITSLLFLPQHVYSTGETQTNKEPSIGFRLVVKFKKQNTTSKKQYVGEISFKNVAGLYSSSFSEYILPNHLTTDNIAYERNGENGIVSAFVRYSDVFLSLDGIFYIVVGGKYLYVFCDMTYGAFIGSPQERGIVPFAFDDYNFYFHWFSIKEDRMVNARVSFSMNKDFLFATSGIKTQRIGDSDPNSKFYRDTEGVLCTYSASAAKPIGYNAKTEVGGKSSITQAIKAFVLPVPTPRLDRIYYGQPCCIWQIENNEIFYTLMS